MVRKAASGTPVYLKPYKRRVFIAFKSLEIIANFPSTVWITRQSKVFLGGVCVCFPLAIRQGPELRKRHENSLSP